MARAAKRNGRPTKTPPARPHPAPAPEPDEGRWKLIDTGLYQHLANSGDSSEEQHQLYDLDDSPTVRGQLVRIIREIRPLVTSSEPTRTAFIDVLGILWNIRDLRKALAANDTTAAVKCAILIGRYWERTTIRPLEHYAATGKRTRKNLAAGQETLKTKRASAQDEREACREAQHAAAVKAVEKARRQMTSKHPKKEALYQKAAKILRISERTLRRRLAAGPTL